MPFQSPPSPALDGALTGQIIDVGTAPNTIIQTTDPWSARLNWNIHGSMVATVNPTDEWHLVVSLDSLDVGSANDKPGLGSKVVAVGSAPLTGTFPNQRRDYQADINIAAGAVNPGLYALSVVLRCTGPGNTPPRPMAGFFEEPLVQFFAPA
jgi:hypothetical protein